MFGRHHSLKTSQRYIDCVNARDLAGLRAVLAESCRLIDAGGGWMEGRETCLAAFERFFALEPNYRLEIASMSRNGQDVLIKGRSTASDPRFAASTLFRARCYENQLHEWQSYSAAKGAAVCRLLIGDRASQGPYVEAPY